MSHKDYTEVAPKRDFMSEAPKRNFIRVTTPRGFLTIANERRFQTFPDTAHRTTPEAPDFQNWGQTDITLSEVLETFGELD